LEVLVDRHIVGVVLPIGYDVESDISHILHTMKEEEDEEEEEEEEVTVMTMMDN